MIDITKATVIDVSGHMTNPALMEDIRKLWSNYDLGNNHQYLPLDEYWVEENEDVYPVLTKYIESLDQENILLHYWW